MIRLNVSSVELYDEFQRMWMEAAVEQYPSLIQDEQKTIEPQSTNQGLMQGTEPETPQMQSRGADTRQQLSIRDREAPWNLALKHNLPTRIVAVSWGVTWDQPKSNVTE
jgi:hypothetical protein